MSQLKHDFIKGIKVIAFAVVLGVGVSYVSAAWNEPTASPPLNNTPAPINVSSVGQAKIGGLTVNTGGASIGFLVPTGTVGIGTISPNTNNALHVVGNVLIDGSVRMADGSEGAGKVLMSNANGRATWQDLPGSSGGTPAGVLGGGGFEQSSSGNQGCLNTDIWNVIGGTAKCSGSAFYGGGKVTCANGFLRVKTGEGNGNVTFNVSGSHYVCVKR